MNLEAGARLGPYEIVEPLGSGGMGEVWRARDVRLHREVAIKVLLPEVATHPERLARFEREAFLLASINHPRIAAIYGVEESGSSRAIVMELVEGSTLADRIAEGALSVEESIGVASQIAEALEAAHEKGIVHRDLKPANVKLTPDGAVKVLDFGLAKALGPAEDDSEILAALAQSPTLTGSDTGSGVVMGTAAYMSPEQARGGEVDKRTDIWSFGVVLWEMLTGRSPFGSSTLSQTVLGVMRGDVDWAQLPAETPPTLRRLLRRCLERDRRRRLRDAGDAQVELEEALAELNSASDKGVGTRQVPRWAALAAGGLGLIAGLAATVLLTRPEPVVERPESKVVHSELALPEGSRLFGWSTPVLAFSPDGGRLAYIGVDSSGVPRLSIHALDSGQTYVVPSSDWAEGPFFSPDGGAVAFAVGTSLVGGGESALRKHTFATGITETICPLADYFGGDWGEDGLIYFVDRQPDGLWRVSAAGGRPQIVVPSIALPTGDEKRSFAWPQLLPGDGRVLVTDWGRMPPHSPAVLDLANRTLSPIEFAASYCRFVPPGHLACLREDGTLVAVAFDAKTGIANGEPVPLLQDVSLSGNRGGVLAISSDGALAYTTGYVRNSGRELFRLVRERAGSAPEVLPFAPEEFARGVRLSPDRTRVALATQDGTLWVYETSRGTRVRVARQPDLDRPAWTRDGRTIVFGYEVASGFRFGAASFDGSAPERMVYDLPHEEGRVSDVTPDGRLIFDADRGGTVDIWSLPLDGSSLPVKLVEAQDSAIAGMVSPDGRLLTYASDDTGRFEVLVRAMPGGPAIPVSIDGGASPRWSPDGGEIYYRQGEQLFAVAVTAGDPPRVGSPTPLFTLDEVRSFDVFGRRDFLLLQRLPGSGVQTRVKLVLGWADELRRQIPIASR